MSNVAAIVLAAGARAVPRGGRGGSLQARGAVAGEPLVRPARDAALGSRARPVDRRHRHAREAVEAALAGLPLGFAHNPAFATGLASSLKAGVAALPGEPPGALVLLGDMPAVPPAPLDRLLVAFAARPDALAVLPFTGGGAAIRRWSRARCLPEFARLRATRAPAACCARSIRRASSRSSWKARRPRSTWTRPRTWRRRESCGARAVSDQLQSFHRNMALPADDDVVVDGDPERRGDRDDVERHLHVLRRGRRIARGMVVHQDDRGGGEFERALDDLARIDRRVIDSARALRLRRRSGRSSCRETGCGIPRDPRTPSRCGNNR